MPKKEIEVDEEQYQRDQRSLGVLRTIAAHPKAKLLLQQAHKEADPTALTPELDQATAANKPLEELKKEFDEYKAKEAEKEAEREKQAKLKSLESNWDAGRAKLRRDKWMDEGITKLEKFMEERGLIDHEVAAAAYERMFPPPPPATPSGVGAWNFLEVPDDTDADIKRLIETKGQSEALADRMAHKALNETRAAMGTARR